MPASCYRVLFFIGRKLVLKRIICNFGAGGGGRGARRAGGAEVSTSKPFRDLLNI